MTICHQILHLLNKNLESMKLSDLRAYREQTGFVIICTLYKIVFFFLCYGDKHNQKF